MSERLTHITLIDKEIHTLFPGEITYEFASHAWYIGCPGEYDGTNEHRGAGNLAGHDVVFDVVKDELTVSPSILCYTCGAHYFIERNQIRWC